MKIYGGLLLTAVALVALTGCSASVEGTPAAHAETVIVEQAAIQVPTTRQGDYLVEIKKQLSDGHGNNDIQLLAAGYEACLRVNESNKDAYREKVLSDARNLDEGLDQLVIAAGAKGILCP